MPTSVSAQYMADRLDRGNGVAVIDIRPIEAYNGWPLNGEKRGGHIAGATPFPATWLRDLETEELAAALSDRGVGPDTEIFVYGYGADDSEAAAVTLAEVGYRPTRTYKEGLPAWADDESRPMSRLPRFTQLVYPGWLKSLLDTEAAPHYDGDRYVLAHTSFENREDYDSGHIPGSISLDTLFLEEPEHWNRRNPEELKKALISHGITHDTTVVLYGRSGNPTMKMENPGMYAGQIAAMRAALLLMYAGVEDVRVLDGGLGAWQSAGYPVTTEETPPTPIRDFGRPIPMRPELVIDIDQAKELLADPHGELVSMRSWEEFIGETSGYHYIGPKGRIPGAVFGNCGSDAYHMENYRNHDNTMRCYHDIAERWREMGVTPDKRIAFYCGTGWRASEAFFYAYVMGWERIAVYDGGWFEWSMDAGNPVEAGIPEAYAGSNRPQSITAPPGNHSDRTG